MSEFCRRLKLILEDEKKAPEEYEATADALYKEVMNSSESLREAAVDHDILRKGIPEQEKQHYAIIKEMYARRCPRG